MSDLQTLTRDAETKLESAQKKYQEFAAEAVKLLTPLVAETGKILGLKLELAAPYINRPTFNGEEVASPSVIIDIKRFGQEERKRLLRPAVMETTEAVCGDFYAEKKGDLWAITFRDKDYCGKHLVTDVYSVAGEKEQIESTLHAQHARAMAAGRLNGLRYNIYPK